MRCVESRSFLICGFSGSFSRAKQDTFHATVAPPRLGGKEKRGVFATRSPFRPNSIGLSCVKLEKVRIDQKLGPVLTVSGLDLLDHTPLFDIKPYLPYVDAHPEAKNGFSGRIPGVSDTGSISGGIAGTDSGTSAGTAS